MPPERPAIPRLLNYDSAVDWRSRLAREGPFLLGALAGAPSRRIVDLGSGTGEHARWLGHQGFEVVGIEGVRERWELAKQFAVPGVEFLRILPARRNTPELLRRIRQLTEQGSFDLLRFTPGNFTDRDFYSEWPIAIRLNGSYHNLALFFDRVGRFSRIINIENLKIATLPRSLKGQTISATFIAKTFVYREAPPPEPVTSQKGKKGPAKAGGK